jgi:hypothetical protein
MDLGSIFLILALAVLVSVFISRPFIDKNEAADLEDSATDAESGPSSSAAQRDHELSTLLAERERLFSTLQELDFDHALKKIPDEDYPEQRRELLEAGAKVLRQLEALGTFVAPLPAESVEESSRPAQAGGKSAESDELENLISSRRRARSENVSGFCPKCGKPIQKSDRFCSRCGTPNKTVENAS